jgi:hypothetical protein
MADLHSDNFVVSDEGGVAVCRVFKNPEQSSADFAVGLEKLVPTSKGLALDDKTVGFVLDLRRTPGAQSPQVEKVMCVVAGIWEATAQRMSFLVLDDPIQKLQVTRIAAQAAPQFGAVFVSRTDARAFAGASSQSDPATVSRILERPSRIKGL